MSGQKKERTCRVCGCTERRACLIDDGLGETFPCMWLDWDLCSNPECVAIARVARQLKARSA
jgi:hypothetical protein